MAPAAQPTKRPINIAIRINCGGRLRIVSAATMALRFATLTTLKSIPPVNIVGWIASASMANSGI